VADGLTMLQNSSQIADVPAQAPTQPAVPEAPASPQAQATGVATETPAPNRIIINGKEIRMEGPDRVIAASTEFPLPPDLPTNVYKIAEVGIISFALMIAAFPVFGFLKALVNRRPNAQTALPSRDTTDRLQRIEAAVDAMAVEVERISEGQRFVTRVLAERSSAQP